VVYFVICVRFGPKSDGLAAFVFGNEVVYCVLGDVWGRGHPRRLGLHAAMLAFICMYNSINKDVGIQFIL
jgi:hypothetical protein